jgi:hypothetical protein
MSKIIVNFDLDLTTNQEFHKEKLEFAQKILDYYNNRLNLNIILQYNKDKFEFNFTNNTTDDFYCTSFVNQSSNWYFQERSVDKDFMDKFIDRKQNKADNIKSSFNTSRGSNTLTKSDVDYFMLEKERFKALYKDINCFTFLSKENQEILKTTLNGICDELDETI